MPHARFEVELTPRPVAQDAGAQTAAVGSPGTASGDVGLPEDGDGAAPGPTSADAGGDAASSEPGLAARFAALGPRGADDVEFLFGANPGVPLRPLRETASGGELSRAMLAIRGMVTLGDDVETLIFDEVDTGIGGVTAAALGERLSALAERRQIVCITHLPQVAAYADRHFAIVKRADAAAGVTETEVRLVDGEERVAELCRMLGASPDDEGARSHAEGLLARAAG